MAAFAWLMPQLPKTIKSLSLATLIGQLYLNYKTPYPVPWYYPSATLLSILVLGMVLGHLLRQASPWRRSMMKLATLLVSVLLIHSLILGLLATRQLSVQQRLIETKVRTQIGLWLKGQATNSDDTVFLEPLGYIGYYSNLKMYDYPGLSSPEVVAARRELKTEQWSQLIKHLSPRPKWLVLRPHEVVAIRAQDPNLLSSDYEVAKVFDVSEQVAKTPLLFGRPYLQYDQKFTIYRLKA